MRTSSTIMVIAVLFSAWRAEGAAARILSVKPVGDLPGRIIDAPPQALDSVVAASGHMLGFDERQDVLLTEDLPVDGGIIPRGTRVSSHMILFNLPDDFGGGDDQEMQFYGNRAENEWTFSGPILGVMSDGDGLLEAASTSRLGAPGTAYPEGDFPFRGLEFQDGYDMVAPTRLRVWMWVVQPGDWIRVITGQPPVAGNPAAIAELPGSRP